MATYSFKGDDLPSEDNLKSTEEIQNKVDKNQSEIRRKEAYLSKKLSKLKVKLLKKQKDRNKLQNKFSQITLDAKPEVKYGKRGGRFRYRTSKNGNLYRQYY